MARVVRSRADVPGTCIHVCEWAWEQGAGVRGGVGRAVHLAERLKWWWWLSEQAALRCHSRDGIKPEGRRVASE